MDHETSFLPYNRPDIGPEEIEEVVAVLKSGWLTTGPRTAQFEQEFRAYTQSAHAIAVSSATAGLHVALAAAGIGPGDEVITTPLTFCSTVHVILHTGATPVLADVGPDGNIDSSCIRQQVTDHTRAILPVHFAGLACDLDGIHEIALRYRLLVIEDAAHAIGTRYRGRPIGAGPSDAVAFSFYATKNLTTGEGGMVTTDDPHLYERMRILALHGMSRDAWARYSNDGSWRYDVVAPGFKYNLSDLQSAIGIHQLRKIERITRRRTELAQRYNAAFAGMDEVEIPAGRDDSRHCWHLYTLKLNLDRIGIDRSEFIRRMQARGIGTTVHFIPIPLHSFFASQPWIKRGACPRALEMYGRLVSLPLYTTMTEDDVDRVIEVVRDIVANSRCVETGGAAA